MYWLVRSVRAPLFFLLGSLTKIIQCSNSSSTNDISYKAKTVLTISWRASTFSSSNYRIDSYIQFFHLNYIIFKNLWIFREKYKYVFIGTYLIYELYRRGKWIGLQYITKHEIKSTNQSQLPQKYISVIFFWVQFPPILCLEIHTSFFK